ncbi:GAP family protein [Herbiconiux sp. CPCC 203407]|uniref:GAP family protein n=1 Tax=Herbiconiux oxytropis TaxID=2970915 RepID=A0AA42BTX6_9MICO|nr:GAP family protein [Herbiconiux oxytropis]MCS5721269.1 GAP family protein [Herbiconiux oxytropis]MCS5726292.1 GAP family protein [Herbiconiux oxytropis]
MAPIIGHILPLALGVALSSVPIVVMVLILLSPRGRWSGLAYLIGAVVGLAGLTVLFTAVASLLPPPPSADESPLFGSIELVLGAALLLLAIIRLVRARRARRAITGSPLSALDELASLDDAPPPGATQRWMNKVTTLGPLPSLGVGFVLMLRPKNLLLTMAAGVAIAAGGEPLAPTTIAIAIFVVLGISTLAAPIIFAVSDPERTRRPLQEIHEWIDRNSAVVTTIVLLVLGTVIVGSGLARY